MSLRVRVVVVYLCWWGVALACPQPAGAQPPRIDVRPSVLDMGTVEVGDTSRRELQVHNLGGLPLTVQRVSVVGEAFAVSSAGPYTFPPGTFWSITVSFTPGSPGLFSAVVTIECNDPAAPRVAVPATGMGRSVPPPPVSPPPLPSRGKPVGSLGGDLRVTGVSVSAPAAGTVFSEDTRVRAEGYIYGSGNGLVTGVWLVDGVVVERFTADMWGGRPVRIVTLQNLPAMSAGRHELVLEILEPPGTRSPPVRYLIAPGTSHDFRLLSEPGFRTYLRTSGSPLWFWTPRPAAAAFEIAIDGNVIDRVTAREWALPDGVRMVLAAGVHEIEVRAVSSRSASPGQLDDPFVLAIVRSRFTLLDARAPLDLSVTDAELVWRGPEGTGLFAIVLLDAAGGTIVRKITKKTAAASVELASLAAGTFPLRVRVEGLNDLGEVVAASTVHEIHR
ncbi:MAG: choice-of-anchor D domain-containing protein [Acidobacteriota bacterium]